jgi:hypothetical protein
MHVREFLSNILAMAQKLPQIYSIGTHFYQSNACDYWIGTRLGWHGGSENKECILKKVPICPYFQHSRNFTLTQSMVSWYNEGG